jgi:hypothetical protein
MKWSERKPPNYIASECGRFLINGAKVWGKFVYMLVDRGEIAAVGSLADCKAKADELAKEAA